MNKNRYTLGIDIGSVAAKAVLYDGQSWQGLNMPTGWSPKQAGRELYERVLQQTGVPARSVGMIVAKGYGRVNLDFAQRTFSEIACHAKGVKTVIQCCGGVHRGLGREGRATRLSACCPANPPTQHAAATSRSSAIASRARRPVVGTPESAAA